MAQSFPHSHFVSRFCAQVQRKHEENSMNKEHELSVRDLHISRVDTVNDIVRGLSVNSATNALCSAENLLHTSGQLLGERLGLHDTSNVEDLVEGNVARVLDVLLLLAITWGLCR